MAGTKYEGKHEVIVPKEVTAGGEDKQMSQYETQCQGRMSNVKKQSGVSGEQGRQGCLLMVTLEEALSDREANEMRCHSQHLWGQLHLAETEHTSLQ